MADSGVDIAKTFGALLIGGIIATMFSGVTQAQTFLYYRLYGTDTVAVKLLVFGVWILDTLHTIFISQSLWNYLIAGFGDAPGIDYIPTSLALTIAVTAVLTFCVHWFFIYRIFVLSKKNYFIAVPLGLIACTRLCFACLTTAKLIELRSLERFVALFTWSFTTGLSLSAALDVLITALMCWLLKSRQREFSNFNDVLDSLILYAFENGILTTLAALLSLITWITMPSNLIFMAAHFIIIKFYANSLLATLNARRNLKPGRRSNGTISGNGVGGNAPEANSRHQPIVFAEGFRLGPARNSMKVYSGSDGQEDDEELGEGPKTSELRINVATTTLCVTDSRDAVVPTISTRSHVSRI